jgi:UDP-glucose 4-epimerase
MRCLVTGGAGFIGSHVVDTLCLSGHEVGVLDAETADSNEQFYWREGTSQYKVNICSYSELLGVFEAFRPEYVFHLAAESRIQPTIEEPQKACEVNFLGSCNVLEACRRYGVKRAVYSSTSSAYGLSNSPPLKEDMPRDCLNPYSVSKVSAEDLFKMYYKLFGVETVILRYFNVYGERQPIKGQYAPVVGIFLRQNAAGESMTIVGDGEQTRDFTHVSDVVSANFKAAFCEDEKAIGEVFNVGTGINYSVNEISKMIKGDSVFIPPRKGEAKDTVADISKTQKILGWKPRIKLPEWLESQK